MTIDRKPPSTAEAREELADLLDRLGEEAADAAVVVARQPGGVQNRVALSHIWDFHARTVSGGRGEESYFPHLYARVWCSEVSDDFGHTGSHGDCPHKILVCVEGAERDDVWQALCDLVDFSPTTEEECRVERRRVKRQVLQRMSATEEPPDRLRPPSMEGVPPMFSHSLNADVDPVTYALARLPDGGGFMAGMMETWYLDRQTGAVVTDGSLSGADMREHPYEEGRYEKIEPLTEREIDLLTRQDVQDIADAYLRSRGFEPSREKTS